MTAVPNTAPARHSIVGDVLLGLRQVKYQQLAFWRNRRNAIMSLAFPVMFLVIFGTLNHGSTIKARGGLAIINFYVPGIIAYAIILTCFNSTALIFAGLRSSGVLKRIRTTPIPWGVYVAGTIGSSILVMFASVVVLLILGVAAFGASVQTRTIPSLIVTIVLGSACMTMLGIAAARLVPKPENGIGILMIISLPLIFISNIFFPLDGAPGWIGRVADVFPVRPLADSLDVAFDPRTHGAGFSASDLRMLAIWTIVGAVIMVRYTRSLTKRS
jgi:ABC-2 type transport system permease protein